MFFDQPQSYYENCKNSVLKFMPIELGLTFESEQMRKEGKQYYSIFNFPIIPMNHFRNTQIDVP